MEENMVKIICSSCGTVLNSPQKFCPECGAPLSSTSSTDASVSSGESGAETAANANAGTNTGMGADTSAGTGLNGFMGMYSMVTDPAVQQNQGAEPVNFYPNDSGLKMIAECADTSGPLAGGAIRSSEIVLYYDEKTDGYQVHTYASAGYGSRKHEGYYTTKELADRVMRSIDVETVLKYKDMPQPLGGSRLLLFRNENDELIRAECSMAALAEIKSSVEKILYEAVKSENRIVPEEAKDWKTCVVFSTGMSMDSCFNYEIERMDGGKVRVRGKCFVRGIAHEHNNWVELSKKEAAELEKIPLGLMISDIVTNPDPMMSAGFAGYALDGNSMSVSITYADGRRDTKTPDGEMIRALDELMKRVF